MNLSFLFLILIAFYFVEQSLGRTISNETPSKVTKNVSSSEETSTASNGKNLHVKIVEKLAALSDEPIKLIIKIIQDAYEDKSDSEVVNIFLTKVLRDYQEVSPEKPVRNIEFFLASTVVFQIVSDPGLTNETSKLRNMYLAIQKALEKYDVKAAVSKLHEKFEEFLNWLTPEIEIHIRQSKLNLEEQREAKKFEEICLQFKEETNLHKKVRSFDMLLAKFQEYSEKIGV